MGLVVVQVEAVFMARAAAQVPAFKEIKVVIINSLVKVTSSISQDTGAIQSNLIVVSIMSSL